MPLCKVNVKGLDALVKQYKGRYSTVVGFQPTGWTHQKESASAKCGRRMQRGTVILHQVCVCAAPCTEELVTRRAGRAGLQRPALLQSPSGSSVYAHCCPSAFGHIRCSPTRPPPVQVPYSEHSSFAELHEFVHWFRPLEIIPSVNNDRGERLERMLAALRQPLPAQQQQRVSSYFR